MKNVLLTALITILIGCHGPYYGEEYTLQIHPEFGGKTDRVLLAVEKWNQASGVLITPIIAVPHNCSDEGTFCIYTSNEDNITQAAGQKDPDPGAWCGVTQRNAKDFASILILDRLLYDYSDPVFNAQNAKTLDQTLIHELGHAIGLVHDPMKGNVMYKSVNFQPLYPTCRDLMQYFTLRNMDYHCNGE